MAACKATMAAADPIPYSTVVTTLARNGVEFGVRNPRAQAHRLLSLTGLEERLTIPDPSAARRQG